MKFANWLFGILFVISAALQYNDPDPYIWIPIYLFAASICFLAAARRVYTRLYWIGIIVFAAYGIFLFFDRYGVLTWATEHNAENIAGSMKASAPWIEETREFFGLMIIIFSLVLNLRWARRRTL